MTSRTAPLPRATPESQGVLSSAIRGFVDAVHGSGIELHSFMLVRHGFVIAEGWWDPYRPDCPHSLHSLTKSFTGAAVGLAIAEGMLSLDDLVLRFFPQHSRLKPGEHLNAMRVRHLLTMSSGEPIESGRWYYVGGTFTSPPGAKFNYTDEKSDVLAEIVQFVTAESVLCYLTPRLFEPIGISSAKWEEEDRSFHMGASGLKLTTEDIARFGLLHLGNGRWGNAQVLPAWWVREATSFQIGTPGSPETDWGLGYGYQFWQGRHGSFWGGGAFGQRCIVMPEQKCVFVSTGGTEDTPALFNLIWERLLPALGSQPLPVSSEDVLHTTLSSLKVSGPTGTMTSAFAERISSRNYLLDANTLNYRRIAFDFGQGYCRIRIISDTGEHRLACRLDGQWQLNRTRLLDCRPSEVAVTGAWAAVDVFEFHLRTIETAYCRKVACRFGQDKVTITMSQNVSLTSETFPVIKGRRQ